MAPINETMNLNCFEIGVRWFSNNYGTQ